MLAHAARRAGRCARPRRSSTLPAAATIRVPSGLNRALVAGPVPSPSDEPEVRLRGATRSSASSACGVSRHVERLAREQQAELRIRRQLRDGRSRRARATARSATGRSRRSAGSARPRRARPRPPSAIVTPANSARCRRAAPRRLATTNSAWSGVAASRCEPCSASQASASCRSLPRRRKLPSRPARSHSVARTSRRACASSHSRSVSSASTSASTEPSKSSPSRKKIQFGASSSSRRGAAVDLAPQHRHDALVRRGRVVELLGADLGAEQVRAEHGEEGARRLDPGVDPGAPVGGGRDVVPVDPHVLAARPERRVEPADEGLVGARVGDEDVGPARAAGAPLGRGGHRPKRYTNSRTFRLSANSGLA